MKKVLRRFKFKMYSNLGKELRNLLPKEYEPLVSVIPGSGDERDMITVSLLIPRHLTRKLMWAFKVWKEN